MFVVIAIDRLMLDAQTTTHGPHVENWDEAYPIGFITRVDMEIIATQYDLQAIVDGPKLPAQTSNVLKRLKVQV